MFKGMGDAEWDLIKTALHRPEKRSRGMPPSDYRYVLNAILWITVTGAPWRVLPKESELAYCKGLGVFFCLAWNSSFYYSKNRNLFRV